MTWTRSWGRTAVAGVLLAVAGVVAHSVLAASPRDLAGRSSVEHLEASQDEATIVARLDEADRLMAQGRRDEALRSFDAALAEAREQVREGLIARALAGRAAVRLAERRTDEGLTDAREALDLVERLNDRVEIARVTTLIARLHAVADRPDEALTFAQRALALYVQLGDRQEEGRVALRAIDYVSDLARTREFTARAVDAARSVGDLEVEGRALHRLGDDLYGRELYEESLQVLLSAQAVFERSGDRIDLGTVHNSIGRVYRAHGRLEEALRQQKRALALHDATDTWFARYARMQSLNAVSTVYGRLGDFEQARLYLEQALALAPQVDTGDASDFLRANLASVLSSLGRYQEAVTILEQVIARGVKVYASTRYVHLSHAYRQLGRVDEALQMAERAIETCGESRDACAYAYASRSEAQARLGNREAALADQRTTLDLLEQLRGQLVPADYFRREFDRLYASGFTTAIDLQLSAGATRLALETAEQGRARGLLDLMATRPLTRAEHAASPSLPLTLRGGPAARAAGDAGSGAAPPSALPATADDLIATARRLESTILTYWVGSDATFIWVITADGTITGRRVPLSRSTLVTLIRGTAPFEESTSGAQPAPALATRGAARVTLSDGEATWRELYKWLIAPVRDRLPTSPGALLTIVPHDILNSLSFAALQSPRGRYLLEDYTLHYSPAGALFRFTAARARADARTGPVLLVSDPLPPRQSTLDAPLPRLPGARAEVATIARQLRRGQVTTLDDREATESRVRELLAKRSVVHFATHAVVQDEDPFASFLALAPSAADTGADGVLTAEDVYGLPLQADLVVLSACRSAAGSVRGDAVATFARAFLTAGTASLVASLWDVADEPTNRLIPGFYRSWLGGATKAASLRRAQLQLLTDLRAGRVQVTTPLGPVPVPEHPVFWASFALFGEPQ